MSSESLAEGAVEITFERDVPPGMMIRADSEQLHRILSNLVRNARQAIEAAGQPGNITIKATEDDRLWSIRIEDNGPGLPKKAQEHLFTAFQGGARKGGTGLGLAIAADLVRGHGGDLLLLETSSEGTIFLVRLPRAEAALDEAAE
jgi:signal transduction histidine kinase